MTPKPKNPCAFCGRKATRLCDYMITVAGTETSIPITCDTPLCGACAYTVNLISIKSTVDRCPDHPTETGPFIYPVTPMVNRQNKCQCCQFAEIAQWRVDRKIAIARFNMINGRVTSPKANGLL